MARVLVQNEWFDELSPKAIYESDFENIVAEQAASIFPDYFVVPFKVKVFTDEDIVIPDLAFVDRQYRGWWVVEVEMNYHSLDDHVLPQVSKLSKGNYGIEHANYLCSKCQTLNRVKIIDMLKGKQPQVLVIVNRLMPEWSRLLTRFDAKVCVVEVFRSEKNQHIFRVNGEYPSIAHDYITDCYWDTLIPRFMVIQSPASLCIGHGERLKIRYENCLTEWERIDGQNRVWLSPKSLNPLPKGKSFSILRNDDGSLIILEKK